jgi:hypothetical protein
MVDIIFDHIFLVCVIVDGVDVDVVFIIYNLLWVLILKGDQWWNAYFSRLLGRKWTIFWKLFTLIHDHFTRLFVCLFVCLFVFFFFPPFCKKIDLCLKKHKTFNLLTLWSFCESKLHGTWHLTFKKSDLAFILQVIIDPFFSVQCSTMYNVNMIL